MGKGIGGSGGAQISDGMRTGCVVEGRREEKGEMRGRVKPPRRGPQNH